MEVLQNEQWLLSLGTFLPLAGVLVMLFIPKREESMIKGTAVATAAATLLVGQIALQHQAALDFVDVTVRLGSAIGRISRMDAFLAKTNGDALERPAFLSRIQLESDRGTCSQS